MRGSDTAQFIRYLITGAWNTAFGYASFSVAYYLLHGEIAYSYMIAYVISGALTILVAFIGYKHFVFRTKGNYARECLRCYAVYGTAALGGFILLPLLVEGLRLTPYVAQAIVVILSVVSSFWGHRKYTFRASS